MRERPYPGDVTGWELADNPARVHFVRTNRAVNAGETQPTATIGAVPRGEGGQRSADSSEVRPSLSSLVTAPHPDGAISTGRSEDRFPIRSGPGDEGRHPACMTMQRAADPLSRLPVPDEDGAVLATGGEPGHSGRIGPCHETCPKTTFVVHLR